MYKNKGRTVSSAASYIEYEDELSGSKQKVKDPQDPQFEQQYGTGNNGKPYGLSTKVALGRLHQEIEKMLRGYEQKWKEER